MYFWKNHFSGKLVCSNCLDIHLFFHSIYSNLKFYIHFTSTAQYVSTNLKYTCDWI